MDGGNVAFHVDAYCIVVIRYGRGKKLANLYDGEEDYHTPIQFGVYFVNRIRVLLELV